MVLETYEVVCDIWVFWGKKFVSRARVSGKKTFTAKTGKMSQKLGFLNLKRNMVIYFHWICSIMEIFCVPTEILFWDKSCFWDIGQNAHS